VTFEHRGRNTLDVCPATDVAQFVLATKLLGESAQAVLATSEQHEPPALAGERAGDCLADPTRRAGDDGYLVVLYRQTFT